MMYLKPLYDLENTTHVYWYYTSFFLDLYKKMGSLFISTVDKGRFTS